MKATEETFEQFWLRYLGAHANPVCRGFHYAASTWALACLAALAITREPLALLAGFVGAYGLAWIGHFFVEGNTPLAFTRPLYSLVADYRMFFCALTGRLGTELERAGVAPRRG
ncbi:Mpo1-like protein [Erythrobacter sp. NE805]|uniref:Mpo1-like protein n=1 Tax=Erythrobacter sp. NE805 TaxID=3389875 RepID=UPI00396B1718